MAEVWKRPAPGVALAYVTRPVVAGEYISVPDGRCGLVWTGGSLWWLGPSTQPWPADRTSEAVVGVRFEHLAGRTFAGTSLQPRRDTRVGLQDLPGRADDAAALERALEATREPVQILVAYASAHASGGGNVGGDVAAQILAAARRGESVAALSTRLAMSTRQLHRRSLDAFGMAPTTLRRIMRLQTAASMWASAPTTNLATLAAKAGFSDQAHLTRETRALTLAPPSRALQPAQALASDLFKTDRGAGA